jgi:hypothetical protein
MADKEAVARCNKAGVSVTTEYPEVKWSYSAEYYRFLLNPSRELDNNDRKGSSSVLD